MKRRHTLSFTLATLAATALLVWVPMAQAQVPAQTPAAALTLLR